VFIFSSQQRRDDRDPRSSTTIINDAKLAFGRGPNGFYHESTKYEDIMVVVDCLKKVCPFFHAFSSFSNKYNSHKIHGKIQNLHGKPEIFMGDRDPIFIGNFSTTFLLFGHSTGSQFL
jgi:hypothetical protein